MELIDKQELLDWIQNCWDWATVDGITSTTVLKQTMTDISQLPTVEAIPKADYENRLNADMVAMLEEISLEFDEQYYVNRHELHDDFLNRGLEQGQSIIQQKIDALTADKSDE